jgi:hypothetical protein
MNSVLEGSLLNVKASILKMSILRLISKGTSCHVSITCLTLLRDVKDMHISDNDPPLLLEAIAVVLRD